MVTATVIYESGGEEREMVLTAEESMNKVQGQALLLLPDGAEVLDLMAWEVSDE